MKKFFKWLGIIIGSGVIIILVAFFLLHEPKPVGLEGEKADQLALKMLGAINKSAWDSTKIVQWKFRGSRSLLWDKERHMAKIGWDENFILLHLNNQQGKAWKDGQEVYGKEKERLLQKGWGIFINDSFWLNAPAKVFDSGTKRSLIDLGEEGEGLLVEYTSGGITPGDAYLWILNDKGFPMKWKIWVQILPVGGLSFTWEQWNTLYSGAKIATFHRAFFIDIPLEIEAAKNYKSLGFEDDPFDKIL